MSKVYAIAIVSALLSACGAPPLEQVAGAHLKKMVRMEMGTGAEITTYKTKVVAEGDLFGIRYKDVDYDYEILCKTPIPLRPMRKYSVENVILLNEFLRAGKGPWEKLDWTPVKRIKMRMGEAELEVLRKSYAERTSLLLCKPGEKASLGGRARFMLKEEGWTAQ